MNYINREIEKLVKNWLFKDKILLLFGARQVGKTTFVKNFLKKYGISKNYYNCELLSVKQKLESENPEELRKYFGNEKFIVLDEAQKIRNIGSVLKIFHDTYPEFQVIATGSSSFDLANKINEPLTGRSLDFLLLPFSINELYALNNFSEIEERFELFLRFGFYPEIINKSEQDSIMLLDSLAGKYLYKDILVHDAIRKPEFLLKLLQLLAFQVGQEVSKNELGIKLGINAKTVDKYLDLLEKTFVIFRLKPLSRNLRNEINKKEKIYFYDLGIRNSIISNFNKINLRNDVGALWENFCIIERVKLLNNSGLKRNLYFWRTHNGKEIDYIEEYNGQFFAYEFKWQSDKYKIPEEFLKTYDGSKIKLINKNNFFDLMEI
jgi:uncharacterized protein